MYFFCLFLKLNFPLFILKFNHISMDFIFLQYLSFGGYISLLLFQSFPFIHHFDLFPLSSLYISVFLSSPSVSQLSSVMFSDGGCLYISRLVTPVLRSALSHYCLVASVWGLGNTFVRSFVYLVFLWLGHTHILHHHQYHHHHPYLNCFSLYWYLFVCDACHWLYLATHLTCVRSWHGHGYVLDWCIYM